MTTQFKQVAMLHDVPSGSMKCVSVGGRRVLLANVGGDVLAADEMCTHEDASLCLGSLRGEWVKCPLHGSRFNLRTGDVADEPAELPLRTYAVKIEGDAIFVELEE